MSDQLYDQAILDAYHFPEHQDELDPADVVADGSNASCGDDVMVFVRFVPESSGEARRRPIAQITWTGKGCAVSQAAADLLCQIITTEKLTLEDISGWTLDSFKTRLNLIHLSPSRHTCLTLALKTLQRAVSL
jgi:nitrogen fixation protein NifU and related proteins